MLELGGDEINYHQEVLDFVQQSFRDHDYTLYLLGKRFSEAAGSFENTLKNVQTFDELATLIENIAKVRTPGMTIFLKSSNSVGLSKVEPC